MYRQSKNDEHLLDTPDGTSMEGGSALNASVTRPTSAISAEDGDGSPNFKSSFDKDQVLEHAESFRYPLQATERFFTFAVNQCRDLLPYPGEDRHLLYVMRNLTTLCLFNLDTKEARDVYESEKPVRRMIMMRNGDLIIGSDSGAIIGLLETEEGLYDAETLIEVSQFHEFKASTKVVEVVKMILVSDERKLVVATGDEETRTYKVSLLKLPTDETDEHMVLE